MGDEIKAVEFVAEIRQVKTMADHTSNVMLNFPEYCTEQSAECLKHHGWQVRGVLEFIDKETLRNTNETDSDRTTNY